MVAEHSSRAKRRKGHVGPAFTDKKSTSRVRKSVPVSLAPASSAKGRTRPSSSPTPAARNFKAGRTNPDRLDVLDEVARVVATIQCVQGALRFRGFLDPEDSTLEIAVGILGDIRKALEAHAAWAHEASSDHP